MEQDNGDVYIGMLRDGKYHGDGELHRNGKLVYRGQFENNQFHGMGEAFGGKNPRPGEFESGKLVRWISLEQDKELEFKHLKSLINEIVYDAKTPNLSKYFADSQGKKKFLTPENRYLLFDIIEKTQKRGAESGNKSTSSFNIMQTHEEMSLSSMFQRCKTTSKSQIPKETTTLEDIDPCMALNSRFRESKISQNEMSNKSSKDGIESKFELPSLRPKGFPKIFKGPKLGPRIGIGIPFKR